MLIYESEFEVLITHKNFETNANSFALSKTEIDSIMSSLALAKIASSTPVKGTPFEYDLTEFIAALALPRYALYVDKSVKPVIHLEEVEKRPEWVPATSEEPDISKIPHEVRQWTLLDAALSLGNLSLVRAICNGDLMVHGKPHERIEQIIEEYFCTTFRWATFLHPSFYHWTRFLFSMLKNPNTKALEYLPMTSQYFDYPYIARLFLSSRNPVLCERLMRQCGSNGGASLMKAMLEAGWMPVPRKEGPSVIQSILQQAMEEYIWYEDRCYLNVVDLLVKHGRERLDPLFFDKFEDDFSSLDHAHLMKTLFERIKAAQEML